ncbi:protein kinase domain-containing protein [Rubripirellula lacrimiformis]|nr:protein kinase [Rubripirellula lacrimiformis]
MFPESPPPSPAAVAAPIGLLDSINNNPQLRQRLGGMPSDEKTITLSPDMLDQDGTGLNWPAESMISTKGSLLETMELCADHSPVGLPSGGELADRSTASDGLFTNVGFVPRRVIANVGKGSGTDVDYRIVGRLGAGGTGVVFQAHQRAVDREVAVKMLRQELAGKQQSRERFLAEARVIGGLDHPNVIALHEVYADQNGALFYSMKRIDGTSWDKQIGELTFDQNIETLMRIADAIRYAHSRGLVHRDIKPENVMLGRFGEVLLADWGLAIHYPPTADESQMSASIGGTPAYMAPELASAASGDITFRTDVYLLGAILYQIQTGHPPHRGETLLQCIEAAANNVIVQTEQEGELMDIAMKAMASNPAERFEDVDAFIAAIKDQRTHDQSVRLVRRAIRQVTQPAPTDNADPYKNYGIADALLGEAIEMWPENPKAHEIRKRLQLEFARIATERGDYDLATNIYEAAGELESDEAVMVQFHRMRRDASQQQVSRYSALFTFSPDAGLLVQMSTEKIVEANRAFAKLFGYTGDQVVGERIGELNLWVCPQRRQLMVDRIKLNGRIDDFEAQFRHTDGHVIDVLIGAQVVEVQSEKMLVSTMRDISLRKKAENDLKQSRSRLRDLQRMAGLATWSYDVRSGELSWNTEAIELAGRDREQGAPTREEYIEMIHPEDRDRLKNAINLALESGAAYEISVRQQSRGSEYRYVLVRGQPIFDEAGKTIEIYGVVLERAQRTVERTSDRD